MTDRLPDFDILADMAKNNPDKLENFLRVRVNELIESAPKRMQQRLRGLQFEIDCQRRIHKNSLDACRKISSMMHDSFYELNCALNSFAKNRSVEKEEKPTAAKVLELQFAN